MFLLDTNVISETRRRRPHGAVLAWIGSIDAANLFVSAVTIGEIQRGIEMTKAQDTSKAMDIEDWLDDIVRSHNIIPMDHQAFRMTARLMVGRSTGHFNDAMIAATAMANDLIVATRNIADFTPLGVRTIDPFGWIGS